MIQWVSRIQFYTILTQPKISKDQGHLTRFAPERENQNPSKSIKIHHIEPLALLGVGNCLSNTKATGQRDSTAWGSW